jgi:copper chaperone CopZ
MNQLYSEFNLQQVKCAGCVSKIEGKLSQIDGVVSAKVNLLDKTLLVEYQQENLDRQIVSAVESLGYRATQGSCSS